MKNLTKILLGAVAVSAIATSASAQGSVTSDSAAVGITVIQPITITKNTDLQFGRVIKGAGKVTVAAANGARSFDTGAGAPIGAGGTVSKAQFVVKAEGGQALTWTVPDTVTLSGPGSLTVTTLKTIPAVTGSLGAEATYTLDVGGEITLAANTPSGSYTGNLAITVAYQ